MRVVAFAPLDLRAVGDFRVLADFVPDFPADDFARVVERRVPFVADADLRVDAAFVAGDVLRRVVVFLPDAALRRVVDLVAEVALRRVVDFVPDVALAREVDGAAEDLRRGVDALRLDPEPVNRFVRPASAVVAFSSCATLFATSSCARVTSLSTGLPPLDRLDLVVFRAAIAFSRSVHYPWLSQYGTLGKGCR